MANACSCPYRFSVRVSRYHHISSALDDHHPIIQELVSGGWAEDQINRDALIVWQRNGEVFFSLGDWAQVPSDDVKAAVKRALGDDTEVGWDFEVGHPDGDGWEQVFP